MVENKTNSLGLLSRTGLEHRCSGFRDHVWEDILSSLHIRSAVLQLCSFLCDLSHAHETDSLADIPAHCRYCSAHRTSPYESRVILHWLQRSSVHAHSISLMFAFVLDFWFLSCSSELSDKLLLDMLSAVSWGSCSSMSSPSTVSHNPVCLWELFLCDTTTAKFLTTIAYWN